MRNLKRRDKLYIQAYREIRGYIINNGLKAGDLLPTEQSLCQTLGVSRNVLREAIKSMELMGMVQACPGRGTVVKEFNLDFIFQNVLFFAIGEKEDVTIHEMFGIRKMLELAYMSQAFQALSMEDLQIMRECANTIRAKWQRKEFFYEDDRAFHLALFRPLNNGVLLSLLEAIWAVDDGFQLEQKQPHLDNTIAKHEAIVDALEKHDFPAFARAMDAHFSSGKYLSSGSYEEY
ncbi:MAG: FadR/GntR family transcriptional regulator [Eubacteriales bacterium]|nr:FadR/GntR family transcriptional regulator [Eubacteriales bacterium]